jgi:L-asparaginase
LRSGTQRLPDVPIVADYAGNDAGLLTGLDRDATDAVVVQAFGGGRASPAVRRAAAALAGDGVPVVMASRVPEGRVMADSTAVQEGILASGDLPPHKARVLLMLALQIPRDPADLQRLLDTH